MDGIGTDSKTAPRSERGPLTYKWLHERVQTYITESHQPTSSRMERWSLWFGLSMAGVGLTVPSLIHSIWPAAVLPLALVCLVAEVTGLGLSVGLMLRRELPRFMRPRENHAAEMDADFVKWQALVAELRRYTRQERESRLAFVTALRHNMGERMGLLLGGIQRLGVLPLLIALYLQFRNWEWGDWAGAFDVNLLAGLLIWAMLLLYAAGWLLVGLRTRLDSYVGLLETSLRD
ncbi:hypothetical protein [Lysobacter soli]|nr:hypothetical protein [Lysobacter soli]